MTRTDPFTEILDRDPVLRAIAETDAFFDGKPGEDPDESVTALLEAGEPGVYAAGSRVTYMGYPAAVVHGNEPAPEWTGTTQPGATVNIRFDKAPRGWSPQMDVYATSVLPIP